LETKGDSGLFPFVGANRKVPKGSQMVMLPTMSRNRLTS